MQASFVLHKAIAIYLFDFTFKAVHIKEEQLNGTGEF